MKKNKRFLFAVEMTKIKRKKLNHRMAQDKKYVCENLVLIL